MPDFISIKDYWGKMHVINPSHIVEIDPNLSNEPNCSSIELSNGRRVIAENDTVSKMMEYLKGVH